jgi:hypothetical protein
MSPPPDAVFHTFHRGLVQSHAELRDGARGIEAAAGGEDDAVTARLVAAFCQLLLNHHKAEDAFFFPAFRAAGRLRSSDVAFLAARDHEHVAIHRLCLALREAGERHGRGRAATDFRATVAGLVRELSAASLPHFAEEEAVLTPAHLATMISARGLGLVYRDMGKNWNRR